MATAVQFMWVDWLMFGAMLLVSVAIGIYCAVTDRRNSKSKDFLTGGKDMQLVPVAISILVSFMSAILILGTPAEMYTTGTMFYVIVIGLPLGMFLSAAIYVPLLYPLKITSSFEYLEKRFDSKAAKLTGTSMMILQQVIYMGIASYAPSTALEAGDIMTGVTCGAGDAHSSGTPDRAFGFCEVTGFPTWATVITVGLVSTFYTFLGGMKAVVWTDVFQSSIMVAGILAIVIQGSISVGGMSKVWEVNYEWDRIKFFDFNPDPTQRHSFWSLVIGGMVGWTSTYGVNQASVQRYCALPTLRKAKSAVLLNILGVFILVTITCLAGIVVFAYYAEKGCDPLTNGDVSNSNQIIPFFVMEKLGYPGLPGLFVACLFSGALSTMSSCLNALSAVTWEDIMKPFLGNLSESNKTWVTRFLVIFYGACGIGMSFMAMNLGGTVLQASLSFTGAASGPLLGIFVLGAFFPWANWIGAVVGSIFGLILPMWISIGAYSVVGSKSDLEFPTSNCTIEGVFNVTTLMTSSVAMTTTTLAPAVEEITGLSRLYTVSYLWYPSIGTATVVVIGLILSFITGANGTHGIDPKYLIPVFDRIFCCLPNSLLRKLRCNMDFENPEDIRADEFADDKEVNIPPEDIPPSIGKQDPNRKSGSSQISLVAYTPTEKRPPPMYPHLDDCNGSTFEYINKAYKIN